MMLGKQSLRLSHRQHHPLTLLFFDLDNFKQINDQFGHAAGDRALQLFAAQLQKTFRESDVIARISGDEFTVLLSDTAADDTETVLERFRSDLSANPRHGKEPFDVQFSCGITQYDPRRHQSIEDLMRIADKAMYRDKAQRR